MSETDLLCRRDLALEPALAPAWAALGLGAESRPRLARVRLARALAASPGEIPARINLAALETQDDPAAARRHLRQALALVPGEPSAWFNLGIVEGRTAEAASAYRRSLALLVEADVLSNLADIVREGDPLIAAIRLYRQALALVPAMAGLVESLAFCLSYDPAATSAEIFALNRRWGALQPRLAAVPAATMRVHDRLRVGYLSADLHDHPVGRNLLGLLEHHSDAVEIFLYGRNTRDPIACRLAARAARWQETASLDDTALAARIRDDAIDVLVLVAGHTPFNRLALAASRPAPVQVAMHDFTTSGLAEVDAVIGDALLMPEGGEEGFVERIERLPSFYLHMPLPEVPLQPVGDGEALLLLSANNPAKLNDRVIDLWGRVLRAVPGARLLLKYRDRFGDPVIRRRWIERFRGSGLGEDRLVFATGEEDLPSHLAAIGRADIALDPFPFNGCTTTYEALWMGVPAVSLEGRRFVGRTGAAMLTMLGERDLAVASEDAYVAAVRGLAADRGRRLGLRTALRRRLKASPLLDAEAHARSVEAVFFRLAREKAGWKERNPSAGTGR